LLQLCQDLTNWREDQIKIKKKIFFLNADFMLLLIHQETSIVK